MIEHILKSKSIDLTLCESPTNPGLKIINLEKIAKLCKNITLFLPLITL